MRRTNIYLDQGQTDSLDRLAEQEGVSRAEIIRRLLNRALANADDTLAADLRAIEDSFGAASDLDPSFRGSGAREEHLGRLWRGAS